ncbi:MAG: hypothetical protein CMJ58_22020 [Planctomycetaceae bacterium]|nr:hypothetical protein [Planctomycetaceae bacterium]
MLVVRVPAATGLATHVLVLLLAVSAGGQTQSEPPPSGPTYQGTAPAQGAPVYAGGGWGGGYHSSTAAGDALQGMSSAISAQGQKNLNDSLAVRNLTAAASSSIDNQVKYTEAQRWRMDTDNQRREEKNAESIAKARAYNAKFARQPLTPQQYDQTTGTVRWPMLCMDASYADYRNKVDQLLAKRAQYGGISMEEFMEVEKQINAWRTQVRADKDKYPFSAVKQAVSFLNALDFTLNQQFG